MIKFIIKYILHLKKTLHFEKIVQNRVFFTFYQIGIHCVFVTKLLKLIGQSLFYLEIDDLEFTSPSDDSFEIKKIAIKINRIPNKCENEIPSFKMKNERITELNGSTLVRTPAELAETFDKP